MGPQPELPQGQMDSLLSIISSQRERFRSRNQELEAVSHHLSPTLCIPGFLFSEGNCFPHLFVSSVRPSGESLHAADHAGPAERAGQPESRQHQALREDQVPAELPWQSASVCV